jgi:hypothetical protein
VAPSQQAAPQGCHLGQEGEVQLEEGVGKEAGDVAGQLRVLLRGSRGAEEQRSRGAEEQKSRRAMMDQQHISA